MTAPRNDDQRLSTYWNALTSGNQADAASLDAPTADLILRLDALSQSPLPGSARERARQRVFDSISTSQENDMTALTLPASLPATNGHSPGRPAIKPRPTEPATVTRRQLWISLAAVLALLLAGMGGLFAYDRLGSNDSLPAVIPAVQEATPAAGTESGWPQFRGGPARTGYSTDPGPGGDLDLRWTFTADEVMNSVVSANGTVYAYGRKGDLYALDAATGEQQWAVDLSANEYSEQNRYPIPAVSDGIIYTGTFDGNIVALDAETGALIWQRTLSPEPITGSPAVAEGALYIVEAPGALLALDLTTGATIWMSPDSLELQGVAPAVANGSVFVATSMGELVAFAAADGVPQWTSEPLNANRVAAYQDGVVYVSNEDGRYRAVDAATGELLWTSAPQQGQGLNVLVTPELLIATNEAGVMQALDLATGESIWSVPGPGNSNSPHASKDTVYAISSDLTGLVAYDLTTGEELGRVAVEEAGSTAAISGDTLVLSSLADQSVVRSFGPGDGAVIENVAGPATVIPAASPIAADESTPADATSAAFDASQVAFLEEITSVGSTDLVGPMAAIAPDGTFYVFDGALNTIFVFSADGELIEQWGEPGSGPGQFDAPHDMGFDADGNIYVIDSYGLRIQKFAPDRTFLKEWGEQGFGNGQFTGDEVNGTVDPIDGLVYTVDWFGGRVQVFDLEGNFLDKWGSPGSGAGQFVHPSTVAIGPDGLVYVGDTKDGNGSRVQIFDKYGTYQGTLLDADGNPTTFSEVWGLAFDSAGNVYVSDYWNGSIRIFDPEWREIGSIENVDGAGPFTNTGRLLIDANNVLYVGDYGGGDRIVKLQLPTASE